MVKRIPGEQCRRNAARRRRRVAARHRLAGRWAEQPEPMFTAGRITYEVGGYLEVTPYGGLAAMHRLVTKLGLVGAINERLKLLKIHLPYHESDHVLNLAYNVLTGGTRLEDIERLRHDVAYMNALGADLIPDPTTAGDFCRRFTEDDVIALMDAINSVRPKLWSGRGRDLLGPVAYIDVDGTIVATTGSYKQGMDISYKGIWGYAPLLVTLANTREVLFLVNRPGNAPSHQAPAEIVALANDRCDQENVIGQLKSGINALRVPLYDLVSNWAYMLIAALAWNTKAWFALMMHRKTDRHDYIRMEFRRFFHSVILIPAMITRRARGITVRLVG